MKKHGCVCFPWGRGISETKALFADLFLTNSYSVTASLMLVYLTKGSEGGTYNGDKFS